jgi:hypothetical protein
MGILGFCYVPYHFVYDVMYPTLIQVYDNNEMFQFPVAVIVSKNEPRQALPGTAVGGEENGICSSKNTEETIYTYDSKLNPVEANISYKCFETSCDIGQTQNDGENAVMTAQFPQCVNGFVIAKATGYADKSYMFSTNQEGSADIILDKLYEVNLSVLVDGQEPSGYALIYFNSPDYSATVAWPQQKSVKLIEGFYNVTAYIYGNTSLTFPTTTTQQCVDVPVSGLLGIFGQTDEKCFDVTIPQETITSALKGGGKTMSYLIGDELLSGSVTVEASSLPNPTSLEQLQKNYDLFETKVIRVVTNASD